MDKKSVMSDSQPRAYTGGGGCKGGSSPHIPVKGGAPLELRDITLLKYETSSEEHKKVCCFFLLILFEGEIK